MNFFARLFLIAVLLAAFPAQAQNANFTFKKPAVTGDIAKDIKTDLGQAKSAVTGKTSDPTAALPCMDISVLTKLTPQNLVPTLKGCEIDGVNHLISGTERALDSAKAFTGSATGTTANGDQDAINCLTPALALFKAAAIVPAVPAVTDANGNITTPATPELDPEPILLFQKYREFTLAGGLTSCPTWFNGPLQATAAAGITGAASIAAGAALLAPK